MGVYYWMRQTVWLLVGLLAVGRWALGVECGGMVDEFCVFLRTVGRSRMEVRG